MADNIRRPARTRMWRRIAIATASVSTVALVAFVVISFLPQGNGAFSIRIDNPYEKGEDDNHFHMTLDEAGEHKPDSPEYVVDNTPLDRMVPTTAEEIENHLKTFSEDKKLQGNDYWCTTKKDEHGNDVADKGLALIYTVYLVNDSTDKKQELKYSVNADSYVTTGESDILDYFRILIQTEEIGDSSSLKNAYYGRRHTNPATANYKNEWGDDREAISTYQRTWGAEQITAVFKTNGDKDGYCTKFNELNETNKTLVNDVSTNFVINEGKTLRFTYVAYFEGNDMDCHGSIPSESYLHLSLHFGV